MGTSFEVLSCYNVLLIFEHVSQFISVLRCYQFLDFIYLQMLLVPHVLSIVSLINNLHSPGIRAPTARTARRLVPSDLAAESQPTQMFLARH